MLEKGTGNTEKKAKGGKVLIAVGAVVIIVLALTVVYLLISNGKEEPKKRRNVVINKENVESQLDEIIAQEPVSSGYYEVTMNSEWRFPDGKSASENAYVENVKSNSNDVYFDINLKDTGDLIYSSPIIPLGSYIKDITLDTELEEGTYDCILTYHLVDEDQNSLSTLKIGLKIIIQA